MVKKENTGGVAPKAKRARIPPEVRAEALRLARSGVSNLEIANRLGIAEGSVRYMKKAAVSTSLVDALAVPDPVTLETTEAGLDAPDGASPEAALAQVDRMIADLRALADVAKADGVPTAAAKAMRDAANLMNLRDRLRKAVAQGSGDAVTIPREIIDREIEAIYGRARTLASVELCPHCGRELRMAAVGAARERETPKETK